MYGMSYVCDSIYLYDLFKWHPVPGVLLAHTPPHNVLHSPSKFMLVCQAEDDNGDTYNLTPH